MSFTKIIITIDPRTDVNTFGRLLRCIGEHDAVEEFKVEVD